MYILLKNNNLDLRDDMISNITKKINDFINNERIPKEQFDELKYVAEITNFNEKILNW